MLLADSVARRLRKQGLEAKQICISLRDTELHTITHQMPLSRPTCLSGELHHGALELFEQVTPDTKGVEFCKEKLGEFLKSEYADGLIEIMNSVDAVKNAQFKVAFDPTLVRGMSYYTGTIFEIAMDEFGGSVGGGGRYDEMIGKFTGNQTCACGFSIGFERIVMLLLERDYQIPGAQEKKAYLIEKNMPADKMQQILAKAMEERNNGVCVNLSIMKKNKKFQKEQLAQDGYTVIEEFFVDRM